MDVEYADIKLAAEQSNLVKYPYANTCKRKYRPQLVTALIFMVSAYRLGVRVATATTLQFCPEPV